LDEASPERVSSLFSDENYNLDKLPCSDAVWDESFHVCY